VALFSLFNSKFIQKYSAVKISFYELLFAAVFLSIVLLIQGGFTQTFFQLKTTDLIYLLILALICTAYPFVVATNLLKKMSPFTIILTNNLEPVYGIVLALMIFGEKEMMSHSFYLGAAVILSCVLLNAWLKNKEKFKG